MSNCLDFQELAEHGRKIGGIGAAVVYQRMCREGVTLAGLGVANLPLVDFLPSIGVTALSVRDRNEPRAELLARLTAMGVHTAFGEGYLDPPMRGVILRTPSLRPDHPALEAARRAGAIVLTEAALLLALCPASIYAITGSDGKTTTAMMSAAMLSAAGRRVFLGGNIGTPLLDRLPAMRATDALVIELSSFQLMDADPPRGRCAVTNLTENHLDWHRDMAEYTAAKANILGGGTAILGVGCPFAPAGGVRVSLSDIGSDGNIFLEGNTVYLRQSGKITRLFVKETLQVEGLHNLCNAMTAAALTADTAAPAAIRDALSRFTGAPHRLAYVGRFAGVACYDSSIDTTPARTMTALAAFEAPPVVILGGRDKSLSYEALGRALTERARGAVLCGECAGAIAAAIDRADPEGRFPYRRARDLAEAVALAFSLAGGRGAILLSPAATSFDQFRNYSERGDLFAALCRMQQ